MAYPRVLIRSLRRSLIPSTTLWHIKNVTEMANRQSQLDTIRDEKVDRVANEFTALWLAPPPIDVAIPRTLPRPIKYKFVIYVM